MQQTNSYTEKGYDIFTQEDIVSYDKQALTTILENHSADIYSKAKNDMYKENGYIVGVFVIVFTGYKLIKYFMGEEKLFKRGVRHEVLDSIEFDIAVKKISKKAIEDELKIHTLEKAPLYKDVEFLKEQHTELINQMVENQKDFTRGINKIADKMDNFGADLTEVKIQVAEIKTKVETKLEDK